jgi:archaellum component FlaC
MKYETEKSFVDELELDSEMSLEEMGGYSEEYATEEDWDEDFLNEDWDDFDKIDRKVEEFSARIAELEEELERVKKQTQNLADSGGLSSELEVLEYKIYVLDEQRDILLGHKDILMGVPGIPNDVVFAELDKKLEAMRLLEAAK